MTLLQAPGRCPYCSRAIVSPLRPTKDHVFTEALGGCQTVLACHKCNSQLGTAVEGKLLAPDSMLNLLRLTHRLGGNPLPGKLADGTEVAHDLRSGEFTYRNPVSTAVVGSGRRVTFQGHPAHVRQLLKRQGLTAEQIETEIALAHTVDMSNEVITCEVTLDLDLFLRLIAKSALGAGTFALGDRFVSSPLADNLRQVLRGGQGTGMWYPMDMLHRVEAAVTAVLPMPLPFTLTPPPGTSQLVFVELQKDCFVFATFNGFGIGGVRVHARTPFDGGFPVVVRDQAGGAIVLSVRDEAARMAHDLALSHLDEDAGDTLD